MGFKAVFSKIQTPLLENTLIEISLIQYDYMNHIFYHHQFFQILYHNISSRKDVVQTSKEHFLHFPGFFLKIFEPEK